ncbi:MAG: hypothetical protein ACTSV3_08180 [Candidatus Thorarchaeota archaeon]
MFDIGNESVGYVRLNMSVEATLSMTTSQTIDTLTLGVFAGVVLIAVVVIVYWMKR